jgi:hypothetical protein
MLVLRCLALQSLRCSRDDEDQDAEEDEQGSEHYDLVRALEHERRHEGELGYGKDAELDCES